MLQKRTAMVFAGLLFALCSIRWPQDESIRAADVPHESRQKIGVPSLPREFQGEYE